MQKSFLEKLVTFRRIAGQPRAVVCDRLGISNSTYGRLAAVLRNESGGKTKQERFAEVLGQVEAFIGDQDPRLVSPAAIARAIGCSEGQASRAKQAIIRKPAPVTTVAKVAELAGSKPDKPPKMFWTAGNRLFSTNRQPEEVGTY